MKISAFLSRKPVCAQSQTELGCANCGLSGLVEGTRILTEAGWRLVDALTEGDRLQTVSGGLVALRQVERLVIWHDPGDCPSCVCPFLVPAGSLGNTEPLLVQAETDVLISDSALQGLFGRPHALVNARHLDGFSGIRRIMPPPKKTIHQLFFDQEELVLIQGGAAIACHGRDQFLLSLIEDADPVSAPRHKRIPRLTAEQADAVLYAIESELSPHETHRMPSFCDAVASHPGRLHVTARLASGGF